MIGRPGSAPWLLAHEIRMYFYNLSGHAETGKAKRGLSRRSLIIWVAMFASVHALAYLIINEIGSKGGTLPPQAGMILTGVLIVLMTLMLSSGLRASVEALFERGDIDLLLSSPLSSRSIFTVRLAGVVLGVALMYLLFLAPLAHAGLAMGQFRWLGIYPAILSVSMIVASAAMLFTLGLVRMLGVRRTRVVAQVIGALSGAMVFILSQLFSGNLQRDAKDSSSWLRQAAEWAASIPADSLLWTPGRAFVGEPLPIVLLLGVGCAVFFLTVHFTHRFFVQGVQQSAGMARNAAPPSALHFNFSRTLARVVLLKEWRLIARDPQLISQVLLQLLYLLPLCFLLFFKKQTALPGAAAAMCFLCSSIASSLGWIIILAEDAPDLLQSAPCSQATIRRAKLAAVMLPPLALVALPLLWVALRHPLAAVLMLALITAAVASSALTVQRFGKPAPRGEFRRRGQGNVLGHLVEGVLSFGWAGLSYLLLWLATAGA